MQSSSQTNQTSQNGTTPLELALAWAFVGIPLAFGVIRTIINSLPLFH